MVRGRVSAALAPLLRPHLPVRPTGAARCFSSGWTGDENQHPTFTHANPHPGHPSVPGSWLVGTWRGEGKGMYPTMKDFTYTEQITFWSVPGLRYLFYTQNTWNPARSYAPFHAESGFLRIQGPPAAPVPQEDTADDGVPTKPSPRPLQHGSGSGTVRCEFILAQPNGLATVEEGEMDNARRSFFVAMKDAKVGAARASTARPPFVTATRRMYTLQMPHSLEENPTLHYVFEMATDTTPELTKHLEGQLRKLT